MKPLILIRPQPASDASLASARALGLDAHAFPLFAVRPLSWDAPDRDSFDALLLGSANALRHGGAALSSYTGKPVYAVGASTAQAAREAGLDVIATGKGGLQDVLADIDPAHTRLLRLTGAARVQIDPPPHVTITERVVYASDPLPMPETLAELLQHESCVVALHSGEAAHHFRSECERLALDMSRIALVTIGPRVTTAANGGWQDVRTAETSDEHALLALARLMCEGSRSIGGSGRHPGRDSEIRAGIREPMQEQTGTSAHSAALPPPRSSLRAQIGLALIAFLLGAALVVWSIRYGYLDDFLAADPAPAPAESGEPPVSPDGIMSSAPVRDERANLDAVSTVEARMAMLEDRFSRLNLQASAASGHAARAENLLIAFAARRMIDRGEPLRYLADQLQLRFANTQPRAVRTIVEFAKSPVTIDGLSARLEALGPELAGKSRDENLWQTSWRSVSDLFIVRRETSQVVSPQARIERARVMLRAGRISTAIAEVERLPGANAATTWIADAQRYADAQQALDLIETTAMIEPNRLNEAQQTEQGKAPAAPASPTPTPAR